MNVSIKRIYEDAAEGDGYRVLVDRLWPRGISKERARLDEWMKEIAPSKELREWFGHDPDRFDAFSEKYGDELSNDEEKRACVEKIVRRSRKQHVTLLYGAKDPHINQAAVLLKYLGRKRPRGE